MTDQQLSDRVLKAAFAVHTALGPGLLESVYEAVMAYELRKAGLQVETQLPVPVIYDDVKLELGFRLDILIENQLVVELKSVEMLLPVHKKQLLTYLKLANYRFGLLINFNTNSLRDQICRLVNGY